MQGECSHVHFLGNWESTRASYAPGPVHSKGLYQLTDYPCAFYSSLNCVKRQEPLCST